MKTSPVSFKNAKALQKYWGTPEPVALGRVFGYLIHNGFVGPLSWKNPVSFVFKKGISPDLILKVSISRIGEFPQGTFHFDTIMVISSREVGRVVKDIKLFHDPAVYFTSGLNANAEDDGEALFVISLSHLKWMQCSGENPSWFFTNDLHGGIAGFNRWVMDWEEYGEPYVSKLRSLDSVVEIMLDSMNYTRPQWVKSDGPRHVFMYEYVAIILFLLRRGLQAKKVLDELLSRVRAVGEAPSQVRSPVEQRVDRILAWANQVADSS